MGGVAWQRGDSHHHYSHRSAPPTEVVGKHRSDHRSLSSLITATQSLKRKTTNEQSAGWAHRVSTDRTELRPASQVSQTRPLTAWSLAYPFTPRSTERTRLGVQTQSPSLARPSFNPLKSWSASPPAQRAFCPPTHWRVAAMSLAYPFGALHARRCPSTPSPT